MTKRQPLSPTAALILTTARRRTVEAPVEAKALGVTVEEAQAAIKALHRAKLIYVSSKPIKNFFGSSCAGYRAV